MKHIFLKTLTYSFITVLPGLANAEKNLRFSHAKSDINYGLIYFEMHGEPNIQSKVAEWIFSMHDTETKEEVPDFDLYNFSNWRSPLFQWWYLSQDSMVTSRKRGSSVGIFVLKTKRYLLRRKTLFIKIEEPNENKSWILPLNEEILKRIYEDLKM